MSKSRPMAVQHGEAQNAQQKRGFDKNAEIHKFSLNQQVLVGVHNFLNKNRKLATKFEGPFKIIELFYNWAILPGKNGKRIKRNSLQLKPFFAPSQTHPSFCWSEIVDRGEGS